MMILPAWNNIILWLSWVGLLLRRHVRTVISLFTASYRLDYFHAWHCFSETRAEVVLLPINVDFSMLPPPPPPSLCEKPFCRLQTSNLVCGCARRVTDWLEKIIPLGHRPDGLNKELGIQKQVIISLGRPVRICVNDSSPSFAPRRP